MSKPDPIDVHVGSRLRMRRTLLGMSQMKLGEALGLTFQQIQKYERGANRIGSSRLFKLSKILDVPVQFFFDELKDHQGQTTSTVAHQLDKQILEKRETLEMVRAYYGLPAPVRKAFFENMKTVRKSMRAKR